MPGAAGRDAGRGHTVTYDEAVAFIHAKIRREDLRGLSVRDIDEWAKELTIEDTP